MSLDASVLATAIYNALAANVNFSGACADTAGSAAMHALSSIIASKVVDHIKSNAVVTGTATGVAAGAATGTVTGAIT